MKVQISDVAVSYRTAEIPDKCSGCSADLIAQGALEVTEFMPVWYDRCSYEPPEGGDSSGRTEYGESGFEWDGGGMILRHGVRCQACKVDLAQGKYTEEDA